MAGAGNSQERTLRQLDHRSQMAAVVATVAGAGLVLLLLECNMREGEGWFCTGVGGSLLGGGLILVAMMAGVVAGRAAWQGRAVRTRMRMDALDGEQRSRA